MSNFWMKNFAGHILSLKRAILLFQNLEKRIETILVSSASIQVKTKISVRSEAQLISLYKHWRK